MWLRTIQCFGWNGARFLAVGVGAASLVLAAAGCGTSSGSGPGTPSGDAGDGGSTSTKYDASPDSSAGADAGDASVADGALNDGTLNDGNLNDGALNDGTLNDGAPSDAPAETSAPIDSGAGDSGMATGCGTSGCTDFPPSPIVDGSGDAGVPPANVATLFGAADAGAATGGPCLYEPATGALFPNNWTRPRFAWTAIAGAQAYELRLTAPQEANDLVVYTTATQWTMPSAIWTLLAGGHQGAPITVSIRVLDAQSQPAAGTGSRFAIAPAGAAGAMTFVSMTSLSPASTTILEGFRVGDESTETVLRPSDVQQQVMAQPPDGGNFPSPPAAEPVGCIGCHTSTPDGQYVGFTAQWPWPNALATIAPDAGTVGSMPPWLLPGAVANLSPNLNDSNYLGGEYVTTTNNVDAVQLGPSAFSNAHFLIGDHIEVTSIGASVDDPENSAGQFTGLQAACENGTSPCTVSQLVWINLEWNGAPDAGNRPTAIGSNPSNGGWGILARTGDESRSAGTPAWSHDGKTIAYTSVDRGIQDGHTRTIPGTSPNADIDTIPYTANAGPGGAGGTATKLEGASDPAYNEYDPAYSPDDNLLAFNRVGVTQDMYFEPAAEVYVVPAAGSTTGAVRSTANDPAACTQTTSPGVQNSYPKFAPAPPGGVKPSADGKLYYWMVFTSTRGTSVGLSSHVQLYIAGVSVDPNANNAITTYPAIYVWNQDPTTDNLTPSWDEAAIPPVVGGPTR